MSHASARVRESRDPSTPSTPLRGTTRTTEPTATPALGSLDRITRSGEADQLSKFDFRRSRRSYRELVADGQLELETHRRGLDARDWPPERPRRNAAGAAERREALRGSWERMLAALHAEPGLTDFLLYTWFEPCHLADATSECLFVGAPGFVRGWLRESYHGFLERAAERCAGRPMRVFVVAPFDSAPPWRSA